MTGNVIINQEGAEVLASGIKSVSDNLGVGASIGRLTATVATWIKNSSLPPLQKTGLNKVGGAAGGLIRTGFNKANQVINDFSINTSLGSNHFLKGNEPKSPSSQFSPAYPNEVSFLYLLFYF